MAPNGQQRAEILDQYWDARVRGETPARTEAIDDFAAAVIARLREPVTSPQLAGAQQRVRQQILGMATAAMSTEDHAPASTQPISAANARLNGAGASRTAFLLAAALLLALGVGLALTVFDFGRDDNRHTIGPAINAPATPSPEATPGDTVLELSLPADELPAGDGIAADLSYITIRPGDHSIWTSRCCRGPIIEYVVSGQYTVTASAEFEVIRVGGRVEQVPADTAVTIGPGDSLLVRNEFELEAENNGSEPVEIVQWALVDDSGDAGSFRGHILSGWRLGAQTDVQGPIPVRHTPAQVQLRKVIVRSGDLITPPLNGLAFMVGTNAYADDEHVADRTIHLTGGEKWETAFLLTMTQPGTGGDATTSNAPRDDQLVQARLPVDDLPTSDRVRTVFDHLWIPPGSTTGGSSNCCSGPMIEYVVTGSYTIRAAAAIEVIRANGAVEQVPANTEVTLGPGDSLISRSETVVQITVGGGVPAELLNWILVDHSPDPAMSEEHVLNSWIVKRDDTKNPLSTVPPYPLTVRIRKVVVPNGESIAAPPDGTLQLVLPVGIAQISEAADGSTKVFKGDGGEWATAYVLTMAQPGAPPGTPAP